MNIYGVYGFYCNTGGGRTKNKVERINFNIDGEEHTINIEHSIFNTKSIKYDERKIEYKEIAVLSPQYNYSFQINNRKYDILVKFNNDIELFIDNQSISTGKKMEEVLLNHHLTFSSILLLVGGIVTLLNVIDMNKFMWLLFITGAADIILSLLTLKKHRSKKLIFISSILLIITGTLVFLQSKIDYSSHLLIVFGIAYVGFGSNFLIYYLKKIRIKI